MGGSAWPAWSRGRPALRGGGKRRCQKRLATESGIDERVHLARSQLYCVRMAPLSASAVRFGE